MKRQYARKSKGWRGHIKTLAECKLRVSRLFLDPEFVDRYFGKPAQQGIFVYHARTNEADRSSIVVSGARFTTIEEAFEATNKDEIERLFYYLSDKKYIIYVEDRHAILVDYGNYKGGETRIIEMMDIPFGNPLRQLGELRFVIKEGERLMGCAREMESSIHDELKDPEAWKDHVKTLGSISLNKSYALLNPRVMHNFFGDPKKREMYHGYLIKSSQTIEDKATFTISATYHLTLERVFAVVEEAQPSQCWYYLPAQKYIIYVEGNHVLCVDYAQFKDGDTLTVEFLNLPRNPLTNFADLSLTIKHCGELIEIGRERQHILLNLPAKIAAVKAFDASKQCNFCRKEAEKTLIACARCHSAYYCDRACQGKDLPKHKLDCVEIKKIE